MKEGRKDRERKEDTKGRKDKEGKIGKKEGTNVKRKDESK